MWLYSLAYRSARIRIVNKKLLTLILFVPLSDQIRYGNTCQRSMFLEIHCYRAAAIEYLWSRVLVRVP